MTQQFRVLISGQTLSGGALADRKAEVGREFGLQGEQLERMLSGLPAVVSRTASREAAEKLAVRLRSVDLEARVDPVTASASPTLVAATAVAPAKPVAQPNRAAATADDELFALIQPPAAVTVAAPAGDKSGLAANPAAGEAVTCPKCGQVQPRRTLCRQCGLDMPRFLAAQEAAEREAREERAADLAARRSGSAGISHRTAGERQAGLIGIGFSGRFGRLDFLAASLASTALWFVFVLLAVSTGKMAFVGFGLLLSSIYGLRCVALRLHDTGRTGWLALVVLVPLIGALMALALLFIGGDEDENDHGPAPVSSGARLALVLLGLAVLGGLGFRSVTQNPETAMRFLEAMRAGQGNAVAGEADDDTAMPAAPVTYARNNRIDIYVIAGCTDCDRMRAWLDANGLVYTLYAVDSDNQAAERLHSTMDGGQGRVNLPVLEINGKVLPGNPDIGEVHRHLRQEAG
jgi:uncharacterized membrane protein YhaH (DUF805 family)/glutaredoxin